MNENLNLEKILKNCPQGTKFYSILFGEIEWFSVLIKPFADYLNIDLTNKEN